MPKKNTTSRTWFKKESKEDPDNFDIITKLYNKTLPRLYRETSMLLSDIFSDTDADWFRDIDNIHKEDNIQPRINLSETDKEYRISAELSGVQEKDIDLAIQRNALLIYASKAEEKEDKAEKYHRIERRYGTFRRTVKLPEDIKEDSIKASFKNGVLKIAIAKDKNKQVEERKIPIKDAKHK